MATVPSPPPPETRGQVVEYETYIDQQIAKTSLYVKSVDLVRGLLLVALTIAAGLLALVLIDHWIVGLNTAARWIALIGLAIAATFVFVTQVLPPLIHSINPEYAAQTVERSFPNLKNGLINYLFFRDRPGEIRDSVFQGVRKQAAVGLADVPVDSAVDRSSIIRLGYAMVAMATLWCGYILISPKNPFQSLNRIAAPWQKITRPSRVDILSVAPGNTQIFRGQVVTVTADVEGLSESIQPRVLFSTRDSRIVDRPIEMHRGDVPGRFQATITQGSNGIQEDLEYYLVAGDATSQIFEVQAIDAPHIVVDRVQYDYPDYTRLADEVIQGEGDVRAVEGTRVTIFGKANQVIRSGSVELLQSTSDPGSAESRVSTASKTAPLTVNGTEGRVRIDLRLRPDRKESIYRAYRLHIVNESDVASQHPIEHAIQVQPDLRPIVEILAPEKRTTEVPVNGVQRIEVRAVDPDFALTKVQLTARLRERHLLREDLLTSPAHHGQFVANYDFVPSQFGLKEGDVVEYYSAAEDNRHSPLAGELDPNGTSSSKQYFRIVGPDPLADPKTDDAAHRDEPGAPNEQSGERTANDNQPRNEDRSDSTPQQQQDQQDPQGQSR